MTAADTLGMRPAIAHCWLSLGELHARANHWDAARTDLSDAASLFRDMGMTSLQERAERMLHRPSG